MAAAGKRRMMEAQDELRGQDASVVGRMRMVMVVMSTGGRKSKPIQNAKKASEAANAGMLPKKQKSTETSEDVSRNFPFHALSPCLPHEVSGRRVGVNEVDKRQAECA